MGHGHRPPSGGRRLTRVAFLTPLPPEPTGIADYAAVVLERLAGRLDVDVYCANRSAQAPPGVRVRPATSRGFRRLDGYDAVVAQVGNSAAHEWIVDWIRHRPAVVVLHELVLHHLVAQLTLGRGDRAGYFAMLNADGGERELPQALAAMAGRAEPLWETAADRYPLARFVIDHASRLIVHSHHMAQALQSYGFTGEVSVVPFPAQQVSVGASRPAREDGTVTVGVFGFITPNKRMPVILRAIKLALPRVPELRLLIVGGSPSGVDPAAMAATLGLPADVVRVTAYSDRDSYDRLLGEVDIGVNLRSPTFGETSAVVVDFVSRAIPVVVSTGGWYDELPDAAVARVPPDGDEVVRLAATLEHLARDTVGRQAMAQAALRYSRTVLDPERTADAYVRAMLAPVGRDAVEDSLRRSLARSIGEVGAVFGTSTQDLSRTVRNAAQDVGVLPKGRL